MIVMRLASQVRIQEKIINGAADEVRADYLKLVHAALEAVWIV